MMECVGISTNSIRIKCLDVLWIVAEGKYGVENEFIIVKLGGNKKILWDEK